MTTFSRLVNSPVHAFQFKEIELDESLKNADLSVRLHHQLDAQFAEFQKADLPITVVTFEFEPFTDPADLTLFINVSVFGQSRYATHELKLGEWLVIEPIMMAPGGTVMTDEDFQAEYGRYAPRTVDTPRPE